MWSLIRVSQTFFLVRVDVGIPFRRQRDRRKGTVVLASITTSGLAPLSLLAVTFLPYDPGTSTSSECHLPEASWMMGKGLKDIRTELR